MAGANFQYDETGGTFYYFLCSFFGLILIPATFLLWPGKEEKEDVDKLKKQCNCDPCYVKRKRLSETGVFGMVKKYLIKLLFIVLWIAFFYLAYQVSYIKTDIVEYDPYQELEIDRGASGPEIRKAYRKLSLVYHPDKPTGDEEKFKRLAKAYAALTNEESKRNWEEYGNPDGPEAMKFGIALPKWLVEGQTSMWVLAVYVAVFIIIMPTVVGIWWYRSIKFSGDQVLIDTTKLYWHFIHKTPNMIMRRAIVILGASFEFFKEYNSEVAPRPTDNEEIPWLIRTLDMASKGKESRDPPLFFPYSQKARALIYAHLARLELPPDTLDKDRLYILSKVTTLISEMVSMCSLLIYQYKAGNVKQQPRLDTVENVMKLSPMLVQAMEANRSPLLQLPHVTEDMLRHFSTKKRHIRSIRQFLDLSPDDRRALLRSLSDEQYRDVLNVCCQMPHIEMECDSKVLDDEDSTITVGSLVTVTVYLTRTPLYDMEPVDSSLQGNGPGPALLADEDAGLYAGIDEEEPMEEAEIEEKTTSGDTEKDAAVPTAKKVWKDTSQQKKKKGLSKKKKQQQKIVKKGGPVTKANGAAAAVPNNTAEDSVPGTPDKTPRPPRDVEDVDGNSDDGEEGQEEAEDTAQPEESSADKGEEDDKWKEFDIEAKRQNKLESKSRESHSVHSPHFPLDKQEWWWVYVTNRKTHELITAPTLVTNLRDCEEVEIKFPAPQKEGEYTFTMCLKSDSYFDMDIQQPIKLHVKKAKVIESHPQWDFSDEEREDGSENDSADESEYEYDEDD